MVGDSFSVGEASVLMCLMSHGYCVPLAVVPAGCVCWMTGSLKHAYKGEWNEDNPELTSCQQGTPDSDIMRGMSPQPVEENAEVVFTYDVEFKVCSSLPFPLPLLLPFALLHPAAKTLRLILCLRGKISALLSL